MAQLFLIFFSSPAPAFSKKALFCGKELKFNSPKKRSFKGSVQRKLRWVSNRVSCWVLAWVCGYGHCSDFKIRRCLILNIFLFPIHTMKLMGELCKVSLMQCQYIGAAICTPIKHISVSDSYSEINGRVMQGVPYAVPIYWRCDLYSD